MDDEVLSDGFERLARLSAGRAPSMAELEGRVVRRRHRRRRRQQGIWLGAVALVLAAVGFATITVDGQPDREVQLTSDPTTTAVPGPPTGPLVFTVAYLPEDLAFRSCNALAAPEDAGLVTGVSCMVDNPATAEADGVRITRVIGGATDDLTDAWDAGDGPAAALASGGSDAPDTARFATLGGTKVLDLAPGGEASGTATAALRLLVGGDLVDLGSTNVTESDLRRVIAGLSMEPPSPEVAAALEVLPEGSIALVQGERPLWVQLDPLQPSDRSRFGGTTVGAEIAVPGSTQLIGVDVTTDIDAEQFLDDLLSDGGADLSEAQIGGRRAVILSPDGMMPLSVPEPRPGPQLFVLADAQSLIRIKDPGGSADQIRAIAEALD